MALDWKKEISFTGRNKGGSKATGTGYPEKTHMNLMVREKRQTDTRRAIPLAIVLVVVVALFAKFGVFDFFDRVNQAQARLSQSQTTLSQLNEGLKDYNTVLEEYESYDTQHLSPTPEAPSVLEVFSMVDRIVAPNATIESIGIDANTLTLNVSQITLDSTGSLVSLLYQDPMVAKVSVSTAATQQGNVSDVTTSMVVTLQREE